MVIKAGWEMNHCIHLPETGVELCASDWKHLGVFSEGEQELLFLYSSAFFKTSLSFYWCKLDHKIKQEGTCGGIVPSSDSLILPAVS